LSVVLLDDGWAISRDPATGVLKADPMRFPSGIPALADYVHMRGLKFGIRTDRGDKTCGGQPGSSGFEKLDANTFVAWGVDYVRSSSCTGSPIQSEAFEAYGRMNSFLATEEKQIFFAIDGGWSWYGPQNFLGHMADSWTVAPTYANWAQYLVTTDSLSHMYAYTGHKIQGWSDIGPVLPNLTPVQRRSQFTTAAVTSSPLLIGFDVLNLNSWDFETLTNTEVIAIQQDLAGIGAMRSVGGPNARAVPPVWSVHGCNTSMVEQQWNVVPVDPSNPDKGVQIFSQYLPGYCLAALSGTENGCGKSNDQVYMVDCKGPAACLATSIWHFDTNGLLKNLAPPEVLGNVPGPYATVDRVSCGSNLCVYAGIFLNSELVDRGLLRQTWKYDAKVKQLSNALGALSNFTCVQSARPSSFNVWGKPMQDGSFVMLFTNNGDIAISFTCDMARCFGPVGMPLRFPVSVRDLWAHKVIGTISADQSFSVVLGANGDSAVFRLKSVPQ